MRVFLEIRCSIPSHLEDDLPELFESIPMLGSEISPESSDRVRLTIYLSEDSSHSAEVERVLGSRGGRDFEFRTANEEDWLAGYRKAIRPFPVGSRWWIDPHPDSPTPAPSGRRRLVIPPRTAFGSGSHESTRLILETLEEMDLHRATVLDVGTGSGILALAADVLGARSVLAVDIDPVAVRTACEIAELQQWKPEVHFVSGSADCAAPGLFQVVLCNMISANFLPLLDTMAAALAADGAMVLAGLLDQETDFVSREMGTRGFRVEALRNAGEWVSLRARRLP